MFCVLAFVRLWQKEVRPHGLIRRVVVVVKKKKRNEKQKRDRSNVKCQKNQKPIKPKNKKFFETQQQS